MRRVLLVMIALVVCAPALAAERPLHFFVVHNKVIHFVKGTVETVPSKAGYGATFAIGGERLGVTLSPAMYTALQRLERNVGESLYGKPVLGNEIAYYEATDAGLYVDEDRNVEPCVQLAEGTWVHRLQIDRDFSIGEPTTYNAIFTQSMLEEKRMVTVFWDRLFERHFLLPFGYYNSGSSIVPVDIDRREIDKVTVPYLRFVAAWELFDKTDKSIRPGPRNFTVYTLPLSLVVSIPEWKFDNFRFASPAHYPEAIDVKDLEPLSVAISIPPGATVDDVRQLLHAAVNRASCKQSVSALADAQQPITSAKRVD